MLKKSNLIFKRIVTILLVLVTTFSFTSCHKSDSKKANASPPTTKSKSSKKVKFTVDINPSLEFTVDKDNKVTSITSNEDNFLKSIDYKKKDITQVILSITDKLIEDNKLDKDKEIDILITSTSNDLNFVSNLVKQIKKGAKEKSLDLEFYKIIVDRKNKEIEKLAKENNISYGRAYFCNEIVQESNGSISISDLLKNITEIVEFSKDKDINMGEVKKNLGSTKNAKSAHSKKNSKNSNSVKTQKQSNSQNTSKSESKSNNLNTNTNNSNKSNTTSHTNNNNNTHKSQNDFWYTRPKYDFDEIWPAGKVWIVVKNGKYGIMESNGTMTYNYQDSELTYMCYDDNIGKLGIVNWDTGDLIDKNGNAIIKNCEFGYGGYGERLIYDLTTNKIYRGYVSGINDEEFHIFETLTTPGICGVYFVKSSSIDNSNKSDIILHLDKSVGTNGIGKAKIYSNGKFLNDEYYSILISTDKKYFAVKKNGKYSIIDLNGKNLYPTSFDNISNDYITTLEFLNCKYFNDDNLAAVKVNGKWGFIKRTF